MPQWPPQSRKAKIAAAVIPPFIVQFLLEVLMEVLERWPVSNAISPVSPILSSAVGFVLWMPTRWTVVAMIVYFPVMYVLLAIFSLILALFVFGRPL